MGSRTVIMSTADEAHLRAVRRAHPMVSDHRIVQLGMRRGLRQLAEDPAELVVEANVPVRSESKEGGAR
jgi:hypothetical protein